MTRLPDAPEFDAARLLLAKMGVAPEDLLGTAAPKPQAPTFADYIPKVAKAVYPRHPPYLWHLLEPHP